MKKSKLAIASFILAFMPIIIPLLFLLWMLITALVIPVQTGETPIQTVEPLEIVDEKVVGGEGIKDIDKTTVPIADITISRIFGGFAFIFFGSLIFTSLFSIVAIVLGIIALIKIKRSNREGRWLAIAGIAISIIFIIMLIVFYIYTGGRGVA